jgi:SNF2 family DNA or RNA helicase
VTQPTKSIKKRYALLTHQTASVKKMKPLKRFFDMSDAGTGKTLVEIHDYVNAKDGGRMLILAPLSLLEAAWVADFRKFAPEVTILPAYAHNREEAFKSNADVIVVNHDAVKEIDDLPPKWLRQFKRIVVDESGAYKHHTSARSKAMARVAERVETIRILNGTPWTNSITDIWHQMKLVDQGRRLGSTFSAFRSAACEPKTDDNGRLIWIDRPGIENTIVQLIKDVSIRHKLEDCVDLPENHRYHVFYDMPAKARVQYNEFASKKIMEFKDKVITAVNGGVLYGKLLQFASGAVYSKSAGDMRDYQLLDDGRYKLVLDLVEARSQSVVFFLWQHQKDLLVTEATKRKLRYAVIDGSVNSATRLKIVQDFQAGLLDVIFAHPKSAAHGLTLTKGVATIWASPTHDLEWFLQGFKRIYRIGQTQRTENIIVLARNTIDERVYFDILSNKNARQTDFMDLATELCK